MAHMQTAASLSQHQSGSCYSSWPRLTGRCIHARVNPLATPCWRRSKWHSTHWQPSCHLHQPQVLAGVYCSTTATGSMHTVEGQRTQQFQPCSVSPHRRRRAWWSRGSSPACASASSYSDVSAAGPSSHSTSNSSTTGLGHSSHSSEAEHVSAGPCSELLQKCGSLEDAQAEVTRRIRTATSFREIQQLYKAYRQLMNPIHVCAYLTRLKQLFGTPRTSNMGAATDSATQSGVPVASTHAKPQQLREAAAWVLNLLAASQHLLPSFTMLELAGCLHALARLEFMARLGARPPAAWMNAAISQTKQLLPTATPAQLSTAVWSLAKLQYDPGPEWLDLACKCSVRLMCLRSSADVAAAGVFVHKGQSIAWLKELDGSVWICNTQALVNLTWGMARLQHNVPGAWAQAMLREVSARWQSLEPYALANLAWGLATLAVQPPTHWLQEFCLVSERALPRAGAFALSVMLWALVTWSYRPPNQWLQAYSGAVLKALPTAQPRHISRSLWSIARIRCKPSRLWFRRVLEQTEVQAFDFDAQAFSVMFWALAKMQERPGDAWVETFLAAMYQQWIDAEGRWGPQELSNLMWALGRWRYAPEPAWADLFWTNVYDQLPAFSAQQQVNVLWGAIRTGQAPPPQCLKAIIKYSYCSRRQHSLQGHATLLGCFAALEKSPGNVWMEAFFESTLPQLQHLARVRPAVHLHNHQPPRQQQQQANTAASKQGQQQQQQQQWAAAAVPQRGHQMEQHVLQQTPAAGHISEASSTSAAAAQRGVGAALSAAGTSRPELRTAGVGDPSASHESVCSPALAINPVDGHAAASAAVVVADAAPGGVPCSSTLAHHTEVTLSRPAFPHRHVQQGLLHHPAGQHSNSQAVANAQVGTITGSADQTTGAVRHAQAPDEYPTPEVGVEEAGEQGPGSWLAAGLVIEKLVSALVVLKVQPPLEWVEAFLDASLVHMPAMRQGNLASLAYGVVLMRWNPSPAWVEAFLQAAQQRFSPDVQVNRISLGKLLYAARRLPGAEAAYTQWKQADWIGDLMEMYD